MRAAVPFALVLAVLSGPPAFAARDDGGERKQRNEAREERGTQQNGSRDRAVRRAQREYGGRVLSVDRVPAEEQQRERYRIKLLSEGNVRTVDIEED